MTFLKKKKKSLFEIDWRGSPGAAVVKNLPANAGNAAKGRDVRPIPGEEDPLE